MVRPTRKAVPRKPLKKGRRIDFDKILLGLVANEFVGRSTMARMMSEGLDAPGRDLDKECGYPTNPTVDTFRKLYKRNGIAKRVNDVVPDESWAVYPIIYETEEDVDTKFERAWKELTKTLPVGHYLHRADRLSGLGRYGILLLGLTNAGKLDTPVPGLDPKTGESTGKKPGKPLKLGYLRPFAEDQAQIVEVDKDPASPRFGLPTFYQVEMGDPKTGVLTASTMTRVHWTRVIHLADNREDSDVVGTPRMEAVLNYILDLRKIGGGSAEMFWKGAFPGFSFETIPDLIGESTMEEETVKEQFEEYMNGLKRYLALDGVTAKPLLPQTADPSKHARQQLEFIAATIGVPLRILLGSESGHLASTQDSGTWNRRVAERQTLYLEPMLIRPFINRLIAIGILPVPARGDYMISWRDLNTMSDKDKALVSLQRSQALMQYVSGGCEAVMPAKEFLTLILGLTREESDAVLVAVAKAKLEGFLTDPLKDKAAERDAKLQVETAKAMPKPPTPAKPPRRPVGKPAGRLPA